MPANHDEFATKTPLPCNSTLTLVTADLAPGQRRDPAHGQVHADVDDANDPEAHGKVLALVHEPEDDGEDDAAEVAAASRQARQNSVGKGVDVRDERKVRAIAGLVEDGHENDESDEGADVAAAGLRRVDLADDDEQCACQETARRDPSLLEPEVAPEPVVQNVRNDTAEWSVHKVEEAEDGGVVAGLGLVEVGEVLLEIGAEDGVDGELTAERACVGSDVEDGLGRVYDR